MSQTVEDTHQTPVPSPAEGTREKLQAEITEAEAREAKIQESLKNHETIFMTPLMNGPDKDNDAAWDAMVGKAYQVNQLRLALSLQAKREKGNAGEIEQGHKCIGRRTAKS
jgi:hypothetical protein